MRGKWINTESKEAAEESIRKIEELKKKIEEELAS